MAGAIANPAEHWESVARSNFKRIDQLEAALKESVKLQSHYAGLLNMHDGGERLQFNNADEWVDRIRSLKEKKKNENN